MGGGSKILIPFPPQPMRTSLDNNTFMPDRFFDTKRYTIHLKKKFCSKFNRDIVIMYAVTVSNIR